MFTSIDVQVPVTLPAGADTTNRLGFKFHRDPLFKVGLRSVVPLCQTLMIEHVVNIINPIFA